MCDIDSNPNSCRLRTTAAEKLLTHIINHRVTARAITGALAKAPTPTRCIYDIRHDRYLVPRHIYICIYIYTLIHYDSLPLYVRTGPIFILQQVTREVVRTY